MIASLPLALRMIALLLFFPIVLFRCGGGGGGDATNGSTPVTEVLSATGISENAATLNGIVIPNGLETEAWFEYGTDNTLSSSTTTSPHQSIGSGLTAVPVSVSIY
jgi:hypothetical protein